jgi:single-strand DNA-binding protein
MAAFNQVTLVGNCTRDIELRKAGSTSVIDIGLAVNDKRKDSSGNWVDDVCFVDVTVFGRSAEVVHEYARKGTCLLISGKLKTETWDDRTSGQKRSKLKIVADKVQLLDRKDGASDAPRPARQAAPAQSQSPAGDDIPFSWMIAGLIASLATTIIA